MPIPPILRYCQTKQNWTFTSNQAGRGSLLLTVLLRMNKWTKILIGG